MVPPHSRRRSYHQAAVAAAVLVALTLAGCVPGWVPVDPDPTSIKGKSEAAGGFDDGAPEFDAGDCWRQDDPAGYYSLWWAGPPPVECDTPHATITTAVLDIDAVAPDFEFPADPYASEYPSSFYEQWALQVFWLACEKTAHAPVGTYAGTRVHTRWFLPSPQEWEAGARWLRCDLGVLALGPFSWENIDPVAATVEEIVALASTDYRLCVNTPHPPDDFGPVVEEEGVEVVACDGPAQWKFGTTLPVSGEEYPGWDEVLAEGTAACDAVLAEHPDRTSTVVLPPTAADWVNGDHLGTCWLL